MIKSKKMKKAYREPELVLVRFFAEDVLNDPSLIPPVETGETPQVIFPNP